MYRWSIESDVFLCLQQVVSGKVRFLSNVGVSSGWGTWLGSEVADGAKVPTKCQSRGYLWKIKSLRAIEATWWPTHTSEGAGHPSRPGSRRRLGGQSARTLPGSTSKYLSPQIKVLHPSTFQLTVTSRPDLSHDTSITTKPVVDHN